MSLSSTNAGTDGSQPLDSITSEIRKAADEASADIRESFEAVRVPNPLGTDGGDTETVSVPVCYLDKIMQQLIEARVRLATVETRMQYHVQVIEQKTKERVSAVLLEANPPQPKMIPTGRNAHVG